ncbi:substrate-binding domain-containing protein [Alteromonadaceae bacterium BrNp21-10]|nr:substrate-binding domain-containing protein [Alteromonadaceae bacterium BrNp21-10]
MPQATSNGLSFSFIFCFLFSFPALSLNAAYLVTAELKLQAPFNKSLKTQQNLTIAYLPPATEYNFYLELGEAIRTKAVNKNWNFIMRAPQNGADWQLHVEMIKEVVSKRTDIIIFSSFLPTTDKAIAPLLKQAVEQGSIVINVNSDNLNLGYPVHALIGVNQRSGTRALAQHVVTLLQPGPAKIAIIEGEPGQFSSERVGGFIDGLQGSNISVAKRVNGHWNAVGGYYATLKILEDTPNIRAIFAANDFEIIGASAAITHRNREDILLYGYDGVSDALALIASKKMTATSAVNAARIGLTTFEVIVDIINGKFKGGFVENPLETVTIGNVDCFLDETQKASIDIQIETFVLAAETAQDPQIENNNNLYIELIKAIYEPLGIRVKFEPVPYKRAEYLVVNQRVDAMIGNFRGHSEGLYFPQWHYHSQQIMALFKKHSLLWQGASSLSGKRVGWLRGYGLDRYIQVDTEKVEHTFRSSALKMLEKDRIDVYIDDQFEILKANDGLQQNKLDLNHYQFAKLTQLKLYPAFSNTAKGRKLARIFDQRMPLLVTSGKLAALFKKWDQTYYPFEPE